MTPADISASCVSPRTGSCRAYILIGTGGSLSSDDYLLSGNVHREKYFSIKNRYSRRWNRGKEGNDEERARIVARWENRSALSGYRASMPFCSRTRRLRATFHSHDDREPAGYWCRAYFREVNRYKCLIFGT